MSRWTLHREPGLRKRNALLLLTLSGVIRPADLEPRYSGERTTAEHQDGPSSPSDPLSQGGTSIVVAESQTATAG